MEKEGKTGFPVGPRHLVCSPDFKCRAEEKEGPGGFPPGLTQSASLRGGEGGRTPAEGAVF